MFDYLFVIYPILWFFFPTKDCKQYLDIASWVTLCTYFILLTSFSYILLNCTFGFYRIYFHRSFLPPSLHSFVFFFLFCSFLFFFLSSKFFQSSFRFEIISLISRNLFFPFPPHFFCSFFLFDIFLSTEKKNISSFSFVLYLFHSSFLSFIFK